MANEIQTAPSTTLADNDDWQQELNLRELSMKGYDGISLTEWAAGNTDRPQIAAGSVIEIDGAIAKFTNQTAITDEGGIADGWCYIKFVVSGADVTPTLTNTFGTWDTAKQGFYDGNDRFSLHKMYRSGAVTKIYTFKSLCIIGQGVNVGTVDPLLVSNLGDRTSTSANLTTGNSYTVPPGVYYVYMNCSSATNTGFIQVKNSGGSWVTIESVVGANSQLSGGTLVFSDGVNIQILCGVGQITYYVVKLFN